MRSTRVFGRQLEDLPIHFSNVRLSRIKNIQMSAVCSYCFPHGFETSNSTLYKDLKCWKRYRGTQYHGFLTQRRTRQHMKYSR